MRTRFLALAVFGAALLCAQEGAPSTGVIVPLPVPGGGFSELKQYLGLTDAQVLALQDVQKSRAAAEQAIYKQINDKQIQLNNLLQSGSRDAAQIGQLMIDVNDLRKQLPVSAAPYREAALKVLTQAQRDKLSGLATALQLQPAASQAIGLNLIDAAYRPVPILMPAFKSQTMEQ